jgi:hypothetical protein
LLIYCTYYYWRNALSLHADKTLLSEQKAPRISRVPVIMWQCFFLKKKEIGRGHPPYLRACGDVSKIHQDIMCEAYMNSTNL